MRHGQVGIGGGGISQSGDNYVDISVCKGIGGLVVSQILTLYTTPVIYLLIDRLRGRERPAPLRTGAAPAE